MDLPVPLVAPFLLNKLGRKPCLSAGFLLAAAFLVLAAVIPIAALSKQWPVIALAILGKVCIGLAFDTSYVFTTELFPTVVRSTCLACCSSLARLGAIAAPLIASLGGSQRPQLPLGIYGGVSLAAGLISLLVGPETKGVARLPDCIQEGEDWVGGEVSKRQNNSPSRIL